MSDNPDYILDLSSTAAGRQEDLDGPAGPVEASPEGVPSQSTSSRKWIGVHFKCCDVYTRIWRNREATAYVGYCPRCNRKIQARIGADGISARFFEAG